MSIEIGSTVLGTIVKLADYGAIVRLDSGSTGLIHISEIADTFVRDVKDYFKERDRVQVKVLSVNNKGRYELSTKNIEQPVIPVQVPERKKPVVRPPDPINLGPEHVQVFEANNMARSTIPFEDLLTRFTKDSQERLLDLKRNIETKQGVKRR